MQLKRRHGWLRSPSVLGGGLLERARSTTLALLGVTAAVGLAMVALALNQSLPLVANSPLPQIPPRLQGVGDAEALTGQAERDVSGPAPGIPGLDDDVAGERRAPATSPSPVVGPTGSTELVVAPAAPSKPDSADGDAPPSGSPPSDPQPQQVPPAPADPPAAEPVSTPAPPSADDGTADPPGVTSAEGPDESSVPPWSNGRGHAYGRSGKGSDYDGYDSPDYDDDDEEEEEAEGDVAPADEGDDDDRPCED